MFRLKIILLSLLISGSVLIAFGLYFLDVVAKVNLERIDREILTVGEGQLRVGGPRHWHELDQSLRFIYGSERARDIIVLVKEAGGAVPYKSAHWPQGVSEEEFPEYDNRLETLRWPPNFPPQGLSHSPRPSDLAMLPGGQKVYSPQPGVTAKQKPSYAPGDVPLAGKSMGIRGPTTQPPLPFLQPQMRIKQPFFKTLQASGKTWRMGIMGNQYVTVLLGMEMGRFYADVARFQKNFLITVPIALLLLAGGGWLLTDRALKPIAQITRTAESITAQGLDQRIPRSAGSSRDLARLVDVINAMLDRLEKSFHQATRFSADAAHELKTPLTILQGVLDDAVQQSPFDSDEQRRYGTLLEEVQRLKAIVQKLLILAHADGGRLALQRVPVNISVLVESAIEDVGAAAPHLRIEAEIAPQIIAPADLDLFKQVIQNLTSNAIKYNRKDGLIRYRLAVCRGNVQLTISNTGAPIPEADREKIFHRFYRVDQSRNSSIQGTGLGLSLAREIVHAHGGTLTLAAYSETLVSFIITLPIAI